uniref:J domain-containing protein n=1 Tax=Panagrolaimus sp. ES5 TaxID=591445 RepID=A0AC34GVF1_9BILA
MVFSFMEHCILTGFLLLCSYKLDLGDSFEGKQLSWFVVFTPLFILSFVSMVISVWSIRHDKTFEFELLFSINIIQFVFVSFKLDSALNWSWTIVFVPSWVLFTLCFIGTFYSLILAIFLGRHSQFLNTHRRSHLFNALSHFILTVPLLIFFVMLANKLDAIELIDDYPEEQAPFIVVFSPLFISLFFSLLLSFGSRTGNYWWYGMRKPFCNYIFESFTCLQQYANISYKFGEDATDSNIPPPRSRSSGQTNASLVNQSPSPSSTSEQVYMLHTNDRTIVTFNDRMKSYYDLLNASKSASSEELKQAYFACLRIHHPDKGAKNFEKFNLLQKAYEVLRDPNQKKIYDLWLKEQNLRADDAFGIIDEFHWSLNTCPKAEEALEDIPICRCCGDNYIIALEDLNHIVDFGNKRIMNSANKILVLGDTGVGKSTFVSTLCGNSGQPNNKSTIGCNIELFSYTFAAGTPNECTEIIELWDVGGTSIHRRTAREIFMDDAIGLILVHDLSNSKSEENLMQWVNLFYDDPYAKRKISCPTQPMTFMPDYEHNQHLPTLIVGSHYDSHHNRARNDTKLTKLKSQMRTFIINLDCRQNLLAGSTERMTITKFFDTAIEKARDYDPTGAYGGHHRRRRIAP